MQHKIVLGDSRSLKQIKDSSVQLIITSPPYWQLKDYGTDNQIGFNDNYEEYINHLNLVWKECYRVLSDGCRLCINIGDQFARSVYYGRYKVIPIRTEIIRFCETLGMDYMGAIIWQKATTMNTTGGGAIMGSFPYPRNGILKMDYEFILIFKKLGTPPKVTAEQKQKSILTKDEWSQYFSSHWNFNGVKQLEHIAMFPEELPKRLIKMFSFYGETVLDPFAGSGTTSLAAMHLGRNSIAYEINEAFIPVIKNKLSGDLLAHQDELSIVKDETGSDFSFEVLPYVFHDPHKMDKKIDVKSLSFGSKIGSEGTKKEELVGVKEVLSPEEILLSSGLKIKLLGVKANSLCYEQAVDFLREKFRKRKVYLKFDSIKFDNNGNLLCYLYLDNRTFINAHLIRTKLVDVDTSVECKYLKKFLEVYANG